MFETIVVLTYAFITNIPLAKFSWLCYQGCTGTNFLSSSRNRIRPELEKSSGWKLGPGPELIKSYIVVCYFVCWQTLHVVKETARKCQNKRIDKTLNVIIQCLTMYIFLVQSKFLPIYCELLSHTKPLKCYLSENYRVPVPVPSIFL